MNTPHIIVSEQPALRKKISISSKDIMPTFPSHSGCHFGRALRTIGAVALIALVGVVSSEALGANPAEELAKLGATGGTDPKGNSWLSIQQSIQQFGHPEFILRLFLSLGLAVGCAWAIAWHPRRSSLANPLSDLEERKALVLLGMVGAVVAELSGTSQTLAFVIFGIGALLRFRTALDNPKLTCKAITVVVVGLACGMGSWAMAVFVTAFSWVLVFWLDSHSSYRIRIRMDAGDDMQPLFSAMQSHFVSHRYRLKSSALYEDKGQMVFLAYIPTGVDPRQVESEIRGTMKKPNGAKINVEMI